MTTATRLVRNCLSVRFINGFLYRLAVFCWYIFINIQISGYGEYFVTAYICPAIQDSQITINVSLSGVITIWGNLIFSKLFRKSFMNNGIKSIV